MQYIKFGFLFLICSLLLTILSVYVSGIFDMFGASLDYVTTGSVGAVMSAIIGYIGWFLDILFLNINIGSYSTYYGGVYIGSISWALTLFRVLFGLFALILILKLIIDR